MLSKNSPAIVMAVIVDEEEADIPSEDAAIDEGPAEERGFWISGWWDASRGCTIPDINCKRAAILFASLFDISGWDEIKDEVEDVLVGRGSTAASEVRGEPVSDIVSLSQINSHSS